MEGLSKMNKGILSIAAGIMLLALTGCGNNEGSHRATTTKLTTAQIHTTHSATAPTVSPTHVSTAKPVFKHPNTAGSSDSVTLYQPEDIPEAYWDVINNLQPIYFPYGCPNCTSNPCVAWLDDYVFLTGHQEIATADYVGYTVVDMDGDGNEELVLQHGDLLVLHEKDGRVYGYRFGFREMELRSDGTHIWSRSAGSEQGVSRIRFLEDHTCQIIDICWVVYDSKDPDTVEYYIGSNQVTQQEYEDCYSKLSQSMPESGKLGRYPIRDKNEEDLTPPGG